nr:hypothetical protein Iba_chr05eCG10150 [Ipomoea batatas]
MSDSDSQKVSGRDYDESDDPGHESFSPSTGGSTFDQIDEVEHVSADAEENEGPLQTATSPEESPHRGGLEDVASSLRRGGAPRELRASKRTSGLEAPAQPHALPAAGEASSTTPSLPQTSALPAPAVASSSAPEPPEADPADAEPSTTRKKMLFLNSEVVEQQKCLLTRAENDEIHALLRGRIPYKRTRALTNAAAKISSEMYDYLIFRTPEGYKKAILEPPDYGQSEKYEPVSIVTRATKTPSAELSQDMAPDKAFVAPAAAPRPKTKVGLGAKKVAAKPVTDPLVADVSAPTPIDTSSGGVTAPDRQVAQGQSRQGKEKRQEPEVEEVLTLKRTKRSAGARPSELQEGLRERDALAATLVD